MTSTRIRAIRNAYDRGRGVDLIPFDVFIPDGATVLVPESATFGANGQRLYVTFPVSVKGKRAGDRTDSIAMDTPAPPGAVVDRRANGSLTQRALLPIAASNARPRHGDEAEHRMI